MHRRHARHRRGSLYVTLLGVTIILSATALITVANLRHQSRLQDYNSSWNQADIAARSFIEMVRLQLASDSNWRKTYSSGVWTSQTLNGYQVEVQVVDPVDNNLADDPTESVDIIATVSSGNVRQKLAVTMYSTWEPIDAVKYPIFSKAGALISSGKTLTLTGGPIYSGALMLCLGTVNGDVKTTSLVNIGTISGTVTTPVPTVSNPDSGVMDDYKALATTISNPGSISSVVLSPASNPYGATNSDGVYYIDTGGQDLVIEKSRIVGTLVVKCSAAKKVRIKDSVLLQPARFDYVTLITDGDIQFELDSSNTILSEASLGINLNPSGTPYNGQADSDTTDQYPNEIQGLLHCKGALNFNNNARVVGAIISEGQLTIGTNINAGSSLIAYDSRYLTSPPRGYRIYKMKIQPSSWRRIVD